MEYKNKTWKIETVVPLKRVLLLDWSSMKIKKYKAVLRRWYNKIYEFFGNCFMKINYKIVNSQFVPVKIKTRTDFIEMMQYMDEKDPLIQKMFGLENLSGTSACKYHVIDKSIVISSRQENNENWLAFIVDAVPEEFSFEFDYVQQSAFCEFQIAFNYESLLNRNRFIVMENKEVLFDDISTGHFFKPLKTNKKNDTIFKNGVWNHVEIICTNRCYEFRVNNVNIMTVSVKKRIHKHNGLAVVLWENFNNRKIEACFRNFMISEIKRK